ncbi:hypothetical protein N9998_00095 [Nitrosopumilus sp.]|nr:hypothetical protein [Nitrosopumilus sp.]
MGRSRITRTFHNRPKTKRIPTPQTTKHVSGSGSRSEEPQRQTYNTPQAYAQEEQNISKTVYKAKNKAKAIKQQRDWHSPLTLFASGVGNQAHDIGGSVHGLATGQDYQVKSVLNRAVDHAFAGDWDSAGRVISDNPYRFAGNVATEVGLAVIPFGMVARGAGIAGKVGSAVARSGKGKKLAMKAIRAEEKRTGRKFTKNEIRNIMDDTPTVKDVQKKTLTEVAKGDTNTSYWSTPAYNRSNIGANFPIERRFDTTIKTAKISKHNQAKYPDQAFLTWGESPILRRLGGYDVSTQPGTFAAARASGKNIGKSSVSRKQLNELETTGQTQNLGKGRKRVTSPFYVTYENI